MKVLLLLHQALGGAKQWKPPHMVGQCQQEISRLEAIASRLEAIASRLEAIAIRSTRGLRDIPKPLKPQIQHVYLSIYLSIYVMPCHVVLYCVVLCYFMLYI